LTDLREIQCLGVFGIADFKSDVKKQKIQNGASNIMNLNFKTSRIYVKVVFQGFFMLLITILKIKCYAYN